MILLVIGAVGWVLVSVGFVLAAEPASRRAARAGHAAIMVGATLVGAAVAVSGGWWFGW